MDEGVTDEHRMGALMARVGIMEGQLRDINRTLTEIQATLNSAKGSWRTLVAVGGLLSAVSALAAGLLHWWKSS